MKIENRTVYISEDGTEFNTEEACVEHERSNKLEQFICEILEDGCDQYWSAGEGAEVIVENISKIVAFYNKEYLHAK